MKLNDADWLTIQFALENEIRWMKEYQESPREYVANSAKEHVKRYEAVLKKMKEMGLHHD
ncbi:MAG TPA: hypothetical protein GX707_17555 [Epulopiscium sp.]|nr:hypothetical protein [Candidatus Epulonipiscium sp.]